mmetsp:Transcript_27007/g.48730  ORF Transcript_27007/g.48730 Transcript_27007/m.48730 type:complete len:252 (-) Transcript_27007:754-1509(-)
MDAVPAPKMEERAALPPAVLASLALRLAAALASFSARFLSIFAFWPSDTPANSSALSALLAFGLVLALSPRSPARFAFSASLALSSASFLDSSCAMNSHPIRASVSNARCNPPAESSNADANSAKVEGLLVGMLLSPPPTRTTLPLANATTPPRAEFPARRATVSSNSRLPVDSEQFISNSIVLHALTIASRAGPWYCGIVLAYLTQFSTPISPSALLTFLLVALTMVEPCKHARNTEALSTHPLWGRSSS